MKLLKKCIYIFFIIIFLLPYSYADDIDLEETKDFYFLEASADLNNTPQVNSKHVIVLDRKTLTVLYEKNAYQKTAMASTTKIMTCILAIEKLSLDNIVTVSKNASSIHGSTLGLNTEDKISVNDLLYGLMLRSR